MHRIFNNRFIKGFTLIEMVVVVVIIGIMAGMVTALFFGATKNRRITSVAEKIALLIPIISQQAILQPAVIGMQFTKKGYQFYRFSLHLPAGKSHWLPIQQGFLAKPETYSFGISVILTKADGKKTQLQGLPGHEKNMVVFLPNGDVSAFSLLIGGSSSRGKSYRIDVAENGAFKMFPPPPK